MKLVRDARMEAVGRVPAGLTEIDRRVFYPLTCAQGLFDYGFGYRDDQWWYEHDGSWLPHCDELAVLMLPGWAKSKGVRMEAEVAEALGIRNSHL